MSRKKPFSYKEFKAIYSKVPRLCVDVVVKTPKGIVLTLRTLPTWNNLWHIPGGTVYFREKLVDAVKRIALDELGIKVEVKKLLGYVEFINEEKEQGFGYSISMAFLCDAKSSNMKPNKDSSEIKYFKIPPKNIVKEHKIFLLKNKLLHE